MIQLRPEESQAIEALYAFGFGLHSQERFMEAAGVFRIMLEAAPTDERGWLALAECHERLDHPLVALELYGAGASVIDGAVRCELARARLLARLDRRDEADEAFDAAASAAESCEDQAWIDVIVRERQAAS